jgi:hypothetical protein
VLEQLRATCLPYAVLYCTVKTLLTASATSLTIATSLPSFTLYQLLRSNGETAFTAHTVCYATTCALMFCAAAVLLLQMETVQKSLKLEIQSLKAAARSGSSSVAAAVAAAAASAAVNTATVGGGSLKRRRSDTDSALQYSSSAYSSSSEAAAAVSAHLNCVATCCSVLLSARSANVLPSRRGAQLHVTVRCCIACMCS